MTHPLWVSHYCSVITAVGLMDELGGLFIFLVLLHGECVDSCEDTVTSLSSDFPSAILKRTIPSDSTTPSERPRSFSTGFMQSLRASPVSPANRDALLAPPASGAAKSRGP